MRSSYLKEIPAVVRWLAVLYTQWLRWWDRNTVACVNQLIANSTHIASKIKKYYGRDSVVIHPPVEVAHCDSSREGMYFLVVSALVPYKRIDLAVEACNQLKVPLVIVGDGPLRKTLACAKTYSGIRFTGWLRDLELSQAYANARALIFPGYEDFGIVPLEAQMFGKPVIAYGVGGILDSVLPVPEEIHEDASQFTGIFFYEQTPRSLANAISRFENLKFDAPFIQQHARKFGRERFINELKSVVNPFLNTALADRAP